MTPTRVMELPLWLAGQRSAVWNEMWQSFCIIEETNEDWNFWRRWYQAFLGEQPLAWDLQRRISVGVKDEAWNQGIEAVSFEIAQIEADWEKENFEEPASELTAGEDPYWNDETARGLPIISEGEAKSLREELHLRAEVTLPETTARFDVTTVKVTSERAVRLAVDRVIDAFDDAKRLCGHNGFNEQRVEVVILDRAHAKYLEDAERLAFDYTDARLSLTQAIEDELPADSALQILISALGVAVTEICAADPEIEKALERNYKRDDTDDDDEPPTRDGETTLLLTDAMRVFPEISSDALAERLQDGLSEVLTGEIVSDTPFDTVDGETQLRHAARRSVVAEMASLTSDMYLKLRAAPKSVQEKLAKHSDSEVFKAVGVTARYSGALALIGAVAKYLAGLLGL
ncbi:MAG: hypothetical protein OXC60_08295 [Litoreibacter sp.]|nr:hypothetical protein [Litoreibacter sp.]